MQICFVSWSLLFEDEAVLPHVNNGFVHNWAIVGSVPKHQIMKQESM